MTPSMMLVPMLSLALAAPPPPNDARPAKTYTWVGPKEGAWSTDTNWQPQGIPGPGDTVVFAGEKARTSATMDLGNGNFYHIGKLQINEDYTGTIELRSVLWVDVLVMKNGSIRGEKKLNISQRTDGYAPATIFETSFWHGGTIGTDLNVFGEQDHSACVDIEGGKAAPHLEGNFTIQDQFCIVKWTAGNFGIGFGKTITNKGEFHAESDGGTIGNDGNAQQKWNFINKRDLMMVGKVTFKNANEDHKDGRVFRRQ